MFEPFLIAFRESFQCAIILALVIGHPQIRERGGYHKNLIMGVLSAFIIGFSLGYIPYMSKHLWNNETWTFWRYISESILFYLSIVFVIMRPNPSPFMVSIGLFVLGFLIFFFNSRTVGFLMQDMGTMKESVYATLATGVAGTITGFTPLIFLKKYLLRIPLQKIFILPSLLMVIGTLQFAIGGVGELENENILIPLQRGLLNFLGEEVKYMQSMLLIQEHPFMKVPFADLARFLSGDRTAMALTVFFIMAPPLFILIHLFARQDPVVNDIQVGAQRRHKIAFFRKELMYQAIPVLTAFTILIILIHAINISLNPLYEPVPIPVREAENASVLKIPLSDRSGDLTDKKLRKYVYYYGSKQILFLAILKPDGSVGVALDECEICRPAEWNKSAQGYAQRGEHLVCKYCMTPISVPTVNSPGGCNPIPLPFKVEGKNIVIALSDLISTFNKAQALDKKGTHL